MTFNRALVDLLDGPVLGRRSELELLVAALASGRHILLEGPPGTGKSTLLRSIADGSGAGFEFVEGNAELTPARLVGAFDPSVVLADGYVTDAFLPGPLARALESGGLLYVEEINRVPEETLNVLITVMSEGELHVPRLPMIAAHPEFRLVAAMNPFDAIGTARISGAVYDRCCRLQVGYQPAEVEAAIVQRRVSPPEASMPASTLAPATVEAITQLVRSTRHHPDLRTGSSVRGAIDTALVMTSLGELRGLQPERRSVSLDAALLALSGRVRVRDGAARSAEEIIAELWDRHLAPLDPDAPADADNPANRPPSPDTGEGQGGSGKVPTAR